MRMALLALGTAAWLPYLYLKFVVERPTSPLPFLALHVPCMFGALGIRIWQWRQSRRTGKNEEGGGW